MDAQKFDTLARALGSTATRRVALKTLGAGTVAAMVGLRAGDAGAATCRTRQSVCTEGRQCCGNKRGKTTCKRLAEDNCVPGKRCCGLGGAKCPNGGCDCCEGFACNAVTFKCQKFP